jgi:non-specific serine/threonine protein kinase
MSLSHLLKFVYNNGTDEVIRRGKKIHAIGYVEFVEHDDLLGAVTFRVKDDNYSTFYKSPSYTVPALKYTEEFCCS